MTIFREKNNEMSLISPFEAFIDRNKDNNSGGYNRKQGIKVDGFYVCEKQIADSTP